jgi:nucleoside-diphosphate-sugar epimerase
MESNTSELILVTGATGFVASHTIQQLLQAGHKVRGTVRSVKNTQKNAFLYELDPEHKDNLELVEADLLDKDSWDAAVKGCTYVLHIASPFLIGNPTEDQVIKPALQGTLNVLEAVLKHGVKKVVLTSSIVAMAPGNLQSTINEDSWAQEKNCGNYDKSKLFAERAAWDFWRKNFGKFELATINPGFILGPVFSTTSGGSEEAIKKMMTGEYPALPHFSLMVVDVRDVAAAHIKALFNPKSNGQRYLIGQKSVWYDEIGTALKEEFGPVGYTKIPTKGLGKFVMTFAAIFVKEARGVQKTIGVEMKVDTSKSKNELGVDYRDYKESLKDMGWSLINKGLVPDKRKDAKATKK